VPAALQPDPAFARAAHHDEGAAQVRPPHFVGVDDFRKADMDDAGWDANGQILTYFLDHCGALIQADGEGFYEGSKLILEMAE
jgi:hypothetical protein